MKSSISQRSRTNVFVDETFGHDHVRQRGEHGDVGARQQRQVMRGVDVRRAHHIDAARVDDDQLGALAQPLLHAAREHRVAVGRVGADHHHDVGLLDRIEVLRTGRGAERGLEAVASRRVANAGARVDVVDAEAGADQLLDEERLLVGATRRRDAADGLAAVLVLDALELGGDAADRFLPRRLAPGVGDLVAHHRIEDALLVGGVAPSEATLDARVAAVGLAVLVGDHAHDFFAAHLGLERAADAAIGARRDDGMLRLADSISDFSLSVAVGHACTQAPQDTHSLSRKSLRHAGRHAALEAATLDRQRERPLHLLARAHAAAADDALRGIVGEVRIGLVLRHPGVIGSAVLLGEDVVGAVVAVADVAQADRAGHVLQLAVAVGRAGQAIERMVGDVEFHHAAADVL